MSYWERCVDGDLLAIRISNSNEPINDDDINHWFHLQDEYLRNFNANDVEYRRLMKYKIKLGNLKLEYLRDKVNKRYLINEINEIEEQLFLMRKEQTSNDYSFEDVKVIASKYQGYHISDNITAFSFFTILKNINKNNG